MQRLTDEGATQKLPSSGLNTETAQGDALPSVFSVALPCVHNNTFLFLRLTVLQQLWQKIKCVNRKIDVVFHQLSVK